MDQYWQYEKAPYLDLALGVTEGEGAALTPTVHQWGGSLRVRINNLQKVDFILLNLDIISGWYGERSKIKCYYFGYRLQATCLVSGGGWLFDSANFSSYLTGTGGGGCHKEKDIHNVLHLAVVVIGVAVAVSSVPGCGGSECDPHRDLCLLYTGTTDQCASAWLGFDSVLKFGARLSFQPRMVSPCLVWTLASLATSLAPAWPRWKFWTVRKLEVVVWKS